MKLDPRIIEGKKPLTCFDTEMAKQFIGKEGFFTNELNKFSDLNETPKTTLKNVWPKNETYCFITSGTIHKYFLPLEWVKEEYRAFTFDEFLDKFQVGQVIRYRSKSQPHIDILESLSVMRINHPYMEVSVRLSVGDYDPQGLFEEFEIFEPEDPLNPTVKDWKPFGVKE